MQRRSKLTLILCAIGSLVTLAIAAAAASATVYTVRLGSTYPTLKSLPPLLPGDIVEIGPGTYNECVRWTASGTVVQPITIRGIGTTDADMPTIDGKGLSVTGAGSVPRALFQIEGDHYVIEHLRFTHAANGENGAGVRVTGAHDTTLRDCRIDNCEMGVMSDRNDDLTVEFCDIGFNGNPEHFAGYAHNLYLAGRNTTIQFCDIHDARAGLDLKSRGHFLKLLYNHIARGDEGELSLVDSDETATPHSDVVAIGNWIESKPNRNGNSWKFIDFGQEGGHRDGTLTLIHNTLVAADSRLRYLNLSSPTVQIVAVNNAFVGAATLLGGDATRLTGTGNVVPSGVVASAGFAVTSAPSALHFRGADGSEADGTPRFEFTQNARKTGDVRRREGRAAVMAGAFATGYPPSL